MDMWNLHIASLFNSKNPIQIQLKHSLNMYMYCWQRWEQSTVLEIQTIEQGRGRNGEDEGWGKIFVCQQDQECDSHYTTINKYDITQRRRLEFKIQISTLDPMFLASFHITVFINYVRLNCRINFYLKTNNAFMQKLKCHSPSNRLIWMIGDFCHHIKCCSVGFLIHHISARACSKQTPLIKLTFLTKSFFFLLIPHFHLILDQR